MNKYSAISQQPVTRSHSIVFRALLALLTLTALPIQPAMANMANPYHAGLNIAEPFVELRQIHITREDLTLDFTRLDTISPRERNGQVPIQAIYRLRNDGAGREVQLLFTTPSLAANGSGVWLDGVEVHSAVTPVTTMPGAWLPPETTPGLDGEKALGYQAKSDSGIYFTAFIPPGEHTIRVQTCAEPCAHASSSATVYWQLAYLLAPARNWASFDTLVVRAQYPETWSVATDPALTGSKGNLSATILSPRQNALSFTLHGPEPSLIDQSIYQVLAALASGTLAIYLGKRVGRMLRRRGTSRLWANIIAPVFGVLCGLANFVLAMERSTVAIERAGTQAAWNVGYGDFLLALVIFVSVFLITDILFVQTSKRAYRSAS